MRRIGVVGCALALGVLIGASLPVRAEETGVAGIHTVRHKHNHFR